MDILIFYSFKKLSRLNYELLFIKKISPKNEKSEEKINYKYKINSLCCILHGKMNSYTVFPSFNLERKGNIFANLFSLSCFQDFLKKERNRKRG